MTVVFETYPEGAIKERSEDILSGLLLKAGAACPFFSRSNRKDQTHCR